MPTTQPKKRSTQRGAAFASGGDDHMFTPQAAGSAKSGQTGKAQNAAPGAQRASGGPRTAGHSLSLPAVEGHTAPPRKGRSEVGGLARPARAGRCAP